ncbi:carbamate kinase [Psychrobacter sp. LV10R520-6]|uniref:carbamate kinase n=1 Tax=Psychrobacter sp. LV10R520-6 TaxID=1415574 RepID=UPI0024CA3D18|nr:carbamate kinase [Psychrobacter sp. LV10R520-6]SNT69882.1 carbamate kinase [Psychrobacter sp. LV10R520-6]
MRLLIALGGNALLKRGEPLSAENQRQNIKIAVEQIMKVTDDNELVIAHGNGPQVGLLALQGAAYTEIDTYPLDVLGAETEGMIGYIIKQELGNVLPRNMSIATLLTQVEVDSKDPAFNNPTKPIGPVYSKEESEKLSKQKGWIIKEDGKYFRRVVASPKPKKIFELKPIQWLLEKGVIVICAGGGGIPTAFNEDGNLQGVEAVIDKDSCASLLARSLECELLVIATDVEYVYTDFGTDKQRAILHAHPDALSELDLPVGSMGPKVAAACEFARATGHIAIIGSLANIGKTLEGAGGTRVSTECEGLTHAIVSLKNTG